MKSSAAIKAYNKVSVESNVVGADSHRLISMLFGGALLAISKAKNDIKRNDIPAKSDAIFKASNIIFRRVLRLDIFPLFCKSSHINLTKKYLHVK